VGIKRGKNLSDIVDGMIIRKSRYDECRIKDFQIHNWSGRIRRFESLAFFESATLTGSANTTHMNETAQLYLCFDWKAMQAGLSTEAGPSHRTVCKNGQDEK
jgi:hypothetical protein